MGTLTDKERISYRYGIIYSIILGLLIFLIIMISSQDAYGATIHGTIYDVLLNPESNVRIEINTVPQQFYISKNGNYTIDVPVGNYSLAAHNPEGSSDENISVSDDAGDYIIDIILEPSIISPVDFDPSFSEPSLDIPNDNRSVNMNAANTKSIASLIIIILLILGIIFLLYIFIRSHKQNKVSSNDVDKHDISKNDAAIIEYEDRYGKNILDIIKKQERITQKDLRKSIPLSEGKISLIISDLEHNGKIRKIKKGRGNILIFVKD